MKKLCTTICLLTLLISTLLAMPNVVAQPTDLYLVFDTADIEAKIAKRYRSCDNLRASASGQFSADELPKILREIPSPKKDIWVVDLRQESHGFIDGLPVSWVSDRNAANVNKSATEIARQERALLDALRLQKSVNVYTLKKLKDGKVTVTDPTVMIPESVETEQQLVTGFGAKYERLYVLDHNKPSDAEVDNFIAFVKYKVKDNDWLHFHCRGGNGRASTFITMYDILRHGQELTFIEILRRQESLGGIRLDAMPTSPNKLWKADSARDRYVFLCEFYNYVTDKNGYQTRSWSDWKKLNTDKL